MIFCRPAAANSQKMRLLFSRVYPQGNKIAAILLKWEEKLAYITLWKIVQEWWCISAVKTIVFSLCICRKHNYAFALLYKCNLMINEYYTLHITQTKALTYTRKDCVALIEHWLHIRVFPYIHSRIREQKNFLIKYSALYPYYKYFKTLRFII